MVGAKFVRHAPLHGNARQPIECGLPTKAPIFLLTLFQGMGCSGCTPAVQTCSLTARNTRCSQKFRGMACRRRVVAWLESDLRRIERSRHASRRSEKPSRSTSRHRTATHGDRPHTSISVASGMARSARVRIDAAAQPTFPRKSFRRINFAMRRDVVIALADGSVMSSYRAAGFDALVRVVAIHQAGASRLLRVVPYNLL